jgi:hypothetical protein
MPTPSDIYRYGEHIIAVTKPEVMFSLDNHCAFTEPMDVNGCRYQVHRNELPPEFKNLG